MEKGADDRRTPRFRPDSGGRKMHPAVLTNAFEPNELAFLQRFFKEICAKRGVAGDTLAATDIASQIIQLYQRGVRDENRLQIELNAIVFSKN
jgi:hypothetical protein